MLKGSSKLTDEQLLYIKELASYRLPRADIIVKLQITYPNDPVIADLDHHDFNQSMCPSIYNAWQAGRAEANEELLCSIKRGAKENPEIAIKVSQNYLISRYKFGKSLDEKYQGITQLVESGEVSNRSAENYTRVLESYSKFKSTQEFELRLMDIERKLGIESKPSVFSRSREEQDNASSKQETENSNGDSGTSTAEAIQEKQSNEGNE